MLLQLFVAELFPCLRIFGTHILKHLRAVRLLVVIAVVGVWEVSAWRSSAVMLCTTGSLQQANSGTEHQDLTTAVVKR